MCLSYQGITTFTCIPLPAVGFTHTHPESADPCVSWTCEHGKLAKGTWFLSVLQGLKHAFVYLLYVRSS